MCSKPCFSCCAQEKELDEILAGYERQAAEASAAKEKEEAEKVYVEAAAAGKRASLLTSKRPNVFSTSVANIGPGESISVEIEYQDAALFADGTYSYRFPLVVNPRYTPAADLPLVAVPNRHLRGWPVRHRL